MAQDKKSNSSKATNDLTPQGDKKQALEKDTKKSSASQNKKNTAESLAKLESEIKANKTADKKESEQSVNAEDTSSQGQTQKPTQQPVKKPEKQEQVGVNKVKKQRNWFAIFAFILSVAASIFVGFFWWQSQLWLKNQEQVEQLKQQTLINTQQSLNQLQAKLSQLQLLTEKKQSQTEQDTIKINDSLTSLHSRIKELGKSQPNYWLAAEAGYLINLAERRLLVEEDVNTAIQLLLDANQRLTAMQDPSVFHIRTAISEDIASLYTIKQPDTDSVYLALSGLIAQTNTLKFNQVYIPKPNESKPQQAEVSSNVDDFFSNVSTSFKRFFGNFITITKHDVAVQPQLPADQQWFVRANLTTQMLMAQNAVLDKNQARYNDAISKMELWAMQYFDETDDSVISFVLTLNALKQKNIGLTLPSGLNSQPLIANYLQQQLALKENTND